MIYSLSSLRDLLKSMIASTRLVALVVDFFGTDAFDVANGVNLPSYLFFPSPAMILSFCFYLPKLDEMVSCQYRDLREPIQIPGCVAIPGKDLVEAVEDRKSDTYKWFLQICKMYSLAKGIVVNSFMDLEPGAIKALQEEPGCPPIYPVGPFVRTGSSDTVGDGSHCIIWLDDQLRGSVLFVSFGSGGTVSRYQLIELALGLEKSGQRFLWVVKSPDDESAKAVFFGVSSLNDLLNYLPDGFLERTKGRGLVVPSWAPQAQILSHDSTGGFLTHCGWNSTLESIVNGVPLIAWPLFAEQKMNAVMLTEDIKVALSPKFDENGLVVREEIAKVVNILMEGEEGKQIGIRMQHLKEAAVKALKQEGSSAKALSELALNWKNVTV
ncbi:UDPGT domain-containing protein [Cephalotus follicularis]|uniref:UDPGT domain-containing protein n=1 Tax=Cephalotus follicularis TaxID=3775 RepID=A0A1Q3BW79_CEPFO|nr:UDPGT domain-containing protein [Cephalotus follicularis]